MSARRIDGNGVARRIRDEVAGRVHELADHGIHPCLAVVLVGDDPASAVYVRMKSRDCREVGIETRDVTLPAETPQEELVELVEELNRDDGVHGVLIQLPLPEGLDASAVVETIRPDKDVDGLHPVNAGRLAQGDPRAFRPCTPAGVLELLRHIDYDPEGKRAVIVGRSNLVGRPLASLLLQKRPGGNATVTVAHSRTRDLASVTREADLLVAAAGRPGLVTGDMVSRGAVVVDVGVNRVDAPETEKGYRLVGDVAIDEVEAKASWITPVPGGVGPMTRAMLLRNVVKAAEA